MSNLLSILCKASSCDWIFGLVTLVSAIGCSTPAGAVTANTVSAFEGKLYHAQTSLSASAKAAFVSAAVSEILLVVKLNIQRGRARGVVLEKLLEFILNPVAFKSEHLLIELYREVPIMKALESGSLPGNNDFTAAAEAFKKAYTIVKNMLPQVTVCFYRFPVGNYHKRDAQWKKRNRSLDHLFSNYHALIPSVFDFYVFKGKRVERDRGYVKDSIEGVLLMGQRLNKPVYPFWHRYHSPKGDTPNPLIDPAEFKDQVRVLVNTSVEERKVAGVIWWGSDFVKFVPDNKSLSTKAARKQAYDPIGDEVLSTHFNLFKEAVRESCQSQVQ